MAIGAGSAQSESGGVLHESANSCQFSWSTVKLDLYGLKFFYSEVLCKPWENIILIKPPKASRIPDILSVEQAGQLFAATRILSYKVFFLTCYSMGLRLGEGIRLAVGDIDAGNMRVHIRDAKGNKDRLVPLPDKTLQVLREFWAMHKHPRFLFPSRKRGLKNVHLVDLPLNRGGIQTAMQSVVQHLCIKKSHATPCATAMPPTCWKPGLICLSCSRSLAMSAS